MYYLLVKTKHNLISFFDSIIKKNYIKESIKKQATYHDSHSHPVIWSKVNDLQMLVLSPHFILIQTVVDTILVGLQHSAEHSW